MPTLRGGQPRPHPRTDVGSVLPLRGPKRRRDDAFRHRDAAYRTFRLGNVIQPQAADRYVEAGFSERESGSISGFEVNSRVGAVLAGKLNLLRSA
jgi:hypothetical protein